MNFIGKLMATLALAGALALAAPASALAYYPYAWFTGTSNFVGPDYFVGAGGFATGPLTAYSAGNNYYGSSNCTPQYGCGTTNYDAMSGQWTGSGVQGGYGQQYGYTGQYGGYTNWQQYVPAQAQQYVYGYSGYGYSY